MKKIHELKFSNVTDDEEFRNLPLFHCRLYFKVLIKLDEKSSRLIVVVALFGASLSPVSRYTTSNSCAFEGELIRSRVL